MGSRPVGYYSYSYKFTRVGLGEIISEDIFHPLSEGDRMIIFEMRSEFFIKWDREVAKTLGFTRETIGSERYDIMPFVGCSLSSFGDVFASFSRRLVDYWMREDQVSIFCEDAFDFMKHQPADIDRIAIAVHFEISTVQQEGESVEDVWKRAILPYKLTPLYLWEKLGKVPQKRLGFKLRTLLFKLRKTRAVSKKSAIDQMVLCPICVHLSCIGDQITKLSCGCAFHYHCIVEKLVMSNQCPNCAEQVYDSRLLGEKQNEFISV